jgi:hypothetical protein
MQFFYFIYILGLVYIFEVLQLYCMFVRSTHLPVHGTRRILGRRGLGRVHTCCVVEVFTEVVLGGFAAARRE